MSIDAQVQFVKINEGGKGKLILIDRQTAGQSVLVFDSAPGEVTALNCKCIWGGDDSIMLGQIEIAKRVSYTKILFCDSETFKRAIANYKE